MPTTLTPADKLGAVAAALAAAFGSIPGVRVFAYEPMGSELAPLPAIVVGSVSLHRVPLEEAEHHLGIDDWLQSWAITLYCSFEGQPADHASARSLIGRMTSVIDIDPTLGGEAREARLVTAEAGYNDPGSPRRLIVVECEVEVLSLMPDPA